MKKLVSSLFAVIVMLFGGIFLTACDSVKITASFKQTEITLEIGQKLDPFSLIEEELSSEEKEKIDFKTAKSSVAYIDAEKRLVGVNYGTTTLYAVSGETSLASCTVNIPKPPITLSKPTTVVYDEASGKITWNAVYYSLGTDFHLVPDYVLELKKDGGEFVKHDIVNQTEFLIEEIGEYTAKVQAKAPSIAFASSEFSDEYTFKIMSAPTDLAFDMDTQTLSWSHNGNPETTTYKVKYLIAGQVQKVITAEGNSVVIPDTLGAGTHTFQIETVPTNSDVFKNISLPLAVEKLSTLTLSFNNGEVSWQGQDNAIGYNVVIYLDGAKVGEETTTETSSTLPKVLATSPSNKYSVTVRALGNEEEFVFGGEVSAEYKFEKLPKAIVSYNSLAKTFEVLNANLGKTTLVLSSTQGADRLGGETSSVIWSVTTAVAYELKAQILALKPAEEIDGDMTEVYKVDNAGDEYELIRNLADFSILYQETDGKAYVKYIDEREENGLFTIKQNNNQLNISATNGAYEVGEVATMFNQANNLSFEVTRTKAPENKTYFIGNSQSLSVQKIASASVLNYENGGLSVEIPENVEIAKIEYIINDQETSSLDLTEALWNIKVRFVAKTTAVDGKYYSSSSYAIFQIKRLEKIANLAVDYASKTIVFDRAINAVNYEIALGEEKILQEENTYNFGDYIGQISVVAKAQTFDALTSAEIGYLDSFTETVDIVKIADIVDLKLQKVADNQVKAVWLDPSETYGKTINYSIYLKFTSEQNEDESYDFVLLQSGITENNYTFASNQFDKVGQYEIKVQITSPNADFLTTETAHSVVLTRFSAPMALTKVGNELTVKNYNAETMVGVKIEQEIDGVKGETLQLSEPKYTINILPGQTLKLKISYQDTFVEETRKYNLGSLASEFTIYKLGNLTNLEYQGITMGQFQFYATPAELDESGQVPNYVQYSYYAQYSASTTNSRTSTTREILYSNPNSASFTFFVKASTPSWQTISAGDTKYLSSDEELSVNVYKENAVKDVQIHTVADGIVLSWKFDTVEDYTLGQNGYLPTFTLRYVNSVNATMTQDVVNDIEDKIVKQSSFGTGRTDESGFYEFKFDKSKFTDIGSYTIAIKAETSGITISSEFVVYTIVKLDKITQISTQNGVSAKLGAQDEEIDLTGVSEVVATGQGITISGTMLDLSGVVAGQEVSLEVYKKAQTGIEASTYYLDGDKTTFKFIKLEKQALRLDLDTNNLSWSSVANLPQDVTVHYALKLSGNDAESEITTEQTTINLNEINILESARYVAGLYGISVKTVVFDMTIVSQDQTEGAKLAYLSSDFGPETTVEKLANVENFKAEYTQNQDEVKFTWSAVSNATSYKLYITNASQETTTLSTTETYFVYNNFGLGATTIKIEALGKGKITSNISQEITVTKLASITDLKVNYQGLASWNPNLESQSVVSDGYVVEIYNSLNEKQCEISLNDALLTSTNLFENETAKAFLDSLNGGEFIVKVYVKGAVTEAGDNISLSSQSAEVVVSKLIAPEIKIEDNKFVVTSSNSEIQNLRYFVQILNGQIEVYNDWYYNAIPVDADDTAFEVRVYATVVQSGIGAYNMLDSNTTIFKTDKLDTVIGLALTATMDESRNQDKVTLSWQAVTNTEGTEIADGYEIYVAYNGEEATEAFFVAPKGQTQYEFDANTTFASSGTYAIKVRAISSTYLYANFSETFSVVRLATMKGAYTSRDAIVHFGQVAQSSQDYTIYAYIKDGTSTIVSYLEENLEKTQLETDFFAEDYLNTDLQEGEFYLHVKYVGTTTSGQGTTITLSSAETVVAGYKLYAPTLTINPDKVVINLADNMLPSGQTVLDMCLTSLTVTNANGTVKDDMGFDISNFEGTELSYPNNWLAGEYTFTAFAQPKPDVFNVLPSTEIKANATRLEAPTKLGFSRAVLNTEELATYLSDEEGFADYLSSKLSFVFETVENANGYILSNQYEEFASYLSSGSNELTIGSALEEFFYKTYSNVGTEEDPESPDASVEEQRNHEISLYAVAPSGGTYINSQKATLAYKTLNTMKAFYSTGEGFSWNTEDSDVTTFIIMSIYDGSAKYWQAKDASQRNSTLSTLQYAGDMSLNIKAIGNVETTGTYENIVLDSQFLTHNKQFTKLATITDLGTDKGFFKFTKIPQAEDYVAEVYGATEEGVINTSNLILKTKLESYATKIKLTNGAYFVGYTDTIASLSANTTYFIKIRAEAVGENILYAEYSNPIQAKVLADTNSEGLTLVNNPDNQLDRKIIRVNVTNNALGLWIVEDGVYTAVPIEDGTDRQYSFTPTVLQGGEKVLKFASYGTTSADPVNEHLLTSTFYTKNLTALETPVISVRGGVITWPTVTGADGYYVYINDNLYGSGMYLTTTLILGNEYGGDKNTPIKVEVIPVVVRDDGLWGVKGTYKLVQNIMEPEGKFENSNFTVKLHKPDGFKVYDGALLWTQGVPGLDNYDESKLDQLYTALTQPNGLTKENLDAFDNEIESLFDGPLTIYSKYSGFNQLSLQITLSDGNGAYTFESDAFTFITLTETQKANIIKLVNYLPERLDAFVRSLQEKQSSGELLYDYQREQTYENITQYAISRLSLILNNFSASNPQVQQLLNAQNNVRFPSQYILFEEYAGSATAGLGYGSYQITTIQYGNNTDWLDSVVSDAQKVYVPMAPQNLKIVEENGNYHLVWDKVVLEDGLTYLANYGNETSTDIVYALYGNNASGNRTLLTTTTGTPYSEQLSLSLTKLIEDGTLDTSITSIYLVAMGNATGDNDQTRILSGLKSQALTITVLPQVLAKIVDGVLNIDPSTDISSGEENIVDKFEVSAHNGTDFERQVTSGTNLWDASVLRASTTYTIDVRFIGGSATAGQESFVLSGKKRTFRVSKLAPMNVSVNTYGAFEWARVANSNGFILNVSEEEGVYIERDARVTRFEATTTGFRNYAFRALGATANVTNALEVYYLNSEINNEQHGIDAVMLSSINRIFIEDGLIKWAPLDTTAQGNQTNVGEDELVIGYKLTFSNEAQVYTTQLDSEVFIKDSAGNYGFDFTNFGEEGEHIVQIQAYALVQRHSLEVGTTTYDGTIYTQLLGQKFEYAFTKIAPPTNIQIYNGQLVWDGAEEDERYMYKITAQNQFVSGVTTKKQVWREEVVAGIQYEFDVRAYQEGKVYSSYTKLLDISTEHNDVIKFTKLRFDTPVTSKITEADGNYISFTLPDSATDLAINLKYKADNESEYSYLNYGDENYSNVITFTNKLVRINVTKLRDGIQSMEYSMQLVPLGHGLYISSNFTDIDRYITPQALSVVYFDDEEKEFYFEALEHVGYSIKDQLFNQKGQLVATYYYSIPVQDHTTQSYYKERSVNNTVLPTISFTPVASGYKHIVSVAVCASNADVGQTALMSPYTTSTYEFNEVIFASEKDLFAEDSQIFSLTTTNALSEYMKANAYGTSNNAYKVDSKEAFANLNLRLKKYSYLSSYTIEVAGLNIEKTFVDEEETTFVFKQTQNIEDVDVVIGHRTVGSLSSIKYTGFDNTYDGQNFSISYTLSPEETNDKVALFRVLESNGIIKNVVINATINYNGASQVSGLVGENNGRIEKVTLASISISGTTINSSTLSSISFGGLVCLNKGEVVNAVNNAQEISFIIRTNGVVVNAGGIVAQNDVTGEIIQSGNNMKISVSAFQEARVGGIAGYNNGLIEECFNTAKITAVCQNNGSFTYVGGIVGYNDISAQINKGYAKGQIIAESNAASVYAGGVVGYTKNTNISYTYSSVQQIVITRNTDGSARKLGGTFVGYADTLTNAVNPNYYVNAPAFGREEDAVIFLSQQIDVTSYTALSDLVDFINEEFGKNIFVYQDSDIHFVWENA